jgi:hypothetical protein
MIKLKHSCPFLSQPIIINSPELICVDLTVISYPNHLANPNNTILSESLDASINRFETTNSTEKLL